MSCRVQILTKIYNSIVDSEDNHEMIDQLAYTYSGNCNYYPFGTNFTRPTDNKNRKLYNGKDNFRTPAS